MALVIAGDRSGVGKTTVTLTLLASLCRRGLSVQSFKVGPDYIDPMFHQHVTGRACRNLDPVLTSEAYVQECFARHIQGVEFALVEGVMGLFDGVTPPKYSSQSKILSWKGRHRDGNRQDADFPQNPKSKIDWASTAHIARLLDLPVLLVLDCSRLSGSIAAIAHGYRSFDPQIKLAGLVLNRVGSDRHLELLKDALEPLQLPILGILRRGDNITIPDRHLGLVPTEEISELDALINRLVQLGDNYFNWEKLLPLLKVETPPQRLPSLLGGANETSPQFISLVREGVKRGVKIKVAVARDRAFNFYYQDNLDILEILGAELVFWSPLRDSNLPDNIQGLYFGGGFPEVFAQELATNQLALQAVRKAILSGMPTYAECGGLMYLCQEIVNFENASWQMVGVLPTTARMGSRLALGYRQAIALQDSPLLAAGQTVWGHEFHRSSLSEMPTKALFKIGGYNAPTLDTEEGWTSHQIHASYVHLHFGSRPEIPARFLDHCASYLHKR